MISIESIAPNLRIATRYTGNLRTRTFLSDFKAVRPKHFIRAEDSVRQLAKLRMRMKNHPENWNYETIEAVVTRFSTAGAKIQCRGVEIEDYVKSDDQELTFFKDGEVPNLDQRMYFYRDRARTAMEQLYADRPMTSEHLVHVSCTGYISPNVAQEFASRWSQEKDVTVTSAYNMGCFAALPAVRIARGLVNAEERRSTVDVVHQEICSLHFNPFTLEAEQIVVQSLFGDGHIRYSLSGDAHGDALEILAMKEILVPETSDLMKWELGPKQFSMRLDREVPAKIQGAIRGLLMKMTIAAGVWIDDDVIFAVHPGGPKIIEAIEEELKLDRSQTQESHDVLRDYGNMSSATLPQIWQKILDNPDRRHGQLVVSLGFGPGLTVSGAIYRLHRK